MRYSPLTVLQRFQLASIWYAVSLGSMFLLGILTRSWLNFGLEAGWLARHAIVASLFALPVLAKVAVRTMVPRGEPSWSESCLAVCALPSVVLMALPLLVSTGQLLGSWGALYFSAISIASIGCAIWMLIGVADLIHVAIRDRDTALERDASTTDADKIGSRFLVLPVAFAQFAFVTYCFAFAFYFEELSTNGHVSIFRASYDLREPANTSTLATAELSANPGACSGGSQTPVLSEPGSLGVAVACFAPGSAKPSNAADFQNELAGQLRAAWAQSTMLHAEIRGRTDESGDDLENATLAFDRAMLAAAAMREAVLSAADASANDELNPSTLAGGRSDETFQEAQADYLRRVKLVLTPFARHCGSQQNADCRTAEVVLRRGDYELGLPSDNHIVTDLTILDALYFATYTITTTGYGDMVPVSAMAKGYTVLANFYEVVFVVFVVFMVAALVAALEITPSWPPKESRVEDGENASEDASRSRTLQARTAKRLAIEALGHPRPM